MAADKRKIKEKLGLVQVYTGEGKGKTTAALGLALRASGRDLSVIMIQFMKATPTCGEYRASENIEHFTLKPMGLANLVNPNQPSKEDCEAAEKALEEAKRAMQSGDYDIVILDEINVAVQWGLITAQKVVDMVRSRPPGVEIVLTGRYAPKEFIDLADLVTEMKCVKHPFEKGIPARRGIEC